jgi:hypothetical protein
LASFASWSRTSLAFFKARWWRKWSSQNSIE